MQDKSFFIVKQRQGSKRKLYLTVCDTCGKSRGYKPPHRSAGDCKSCAKKKIAGTLGVTKVCIECGTSEVPDPSKQWFAGPLCYKCYGRHYRQDNKEQVNQSIRDWRAANPERVRENDKGWRKANLDRVKINCKNWVEANRDHVRKNCADYQKRKEKEDPNFRIARRMRHRFYEAVKNYNNDAIDAISKYITYSMDELRQHLESLFEADMTWDNYGKWHIDHIEPLCGFNLLDPKQMKEAWKLSNLRPLWARPNWQKSAEDKLKKWKPNQ